MGYGFFGRGTWFAALLASMPVANASAQTTHLVGPGGHPTMLAALAVAAPGDTLLVQPGVYLDTWIVDIGVTIRAVTPGTVTFSSLLQFTMMNPPAGQQLHLVGINMFQVLANGTVTMDQCAMSAGSDTLWARDATVHLRDCTLQVHPTFLGTNGAAALCASNSTVTAIDTTFTGASGTSTCVGVRLAGSTLHASGCTISGGQPQPVVPALEADATSTIWLSDSTVSSNPATCPIVAPNASGQMARSILTPNCGALPGGPLLGVEQLSPITTGAPFSLTFRTDPNESIAIFASYDLGHQQSPLFAQPALLGSPNWAAGILIADANGNASATWNIPAGPGFVDRTLWVQGYAGLAAPLQLSPVAGGVVR